MLCRSVTLRLLTVLFFLTGCTRQEEPAAPVVRAKPRPAPAPKGPPAKDFQTPWQTESEYIVTMVAADLTEMAYYAKHGRAPAKELPVEVKELPASSEARPVYQVKADLGEAGEATCELTITTPLWAPATYAPLVRVLFEKLQLSGAEAEPVAGGEVLKQLQDLRVETLTRVDGELSERLTREFTLAERHAEAALLLGAFTLRQTNGLFYQIRTELCRMSAHLAFAGGLRAGRKPSQTGRLAEAMLTVLYNNQADALQLLAAVPDTGDAGVWKRILRMRATGDFRIIGESQTHTLGEELEWFQTRAESVAKDRAWESLRLGEEQQALADWTRVLGAKRSTVPIGHIVLRAALPAEFREVAIAYEAEEAKALPKEGLVEALNVEPRRCVAGKPDGSARVKIIGWGTWAAFLQRQLCQALTTNFLFMRDMWAVPDEARQYQEGIDREFWGLRLYPFVRRQCAPDYEYYKKAQDEEMALVRRTPHIVPAGAWNYVSFETSLGPTYWPPPHPFINEWHRPNPVPGTAYNPWPRMSHRSLVERPDVVARLERMHQLAPYDEIVSHNLLRIRDGEKQTAELVEKTYAAGLDFQTAPLRKLARLTQDPGAKEKLIRKSAALDPSDYYQLAQFYIAQQREDEAAEAYVEWIANEVDDVSVANSADWLIRYFERKGDIASARNLADRAAAAYSAPGLLSKADLLERQNELAAALDLHRKQAERYNNYGPMIGFLLRLKAQGNRDYDDVREEVLKKFMSGLVKFDKAAAQAAPRKGVRVTSDNPANGDVGLRLNDVIVAVRGYRVMDQRTFLALRDSSSDEPYTVVVWRRGRYMELPAVKAGYRYDVSLDDFSAK